MRSPILRWTPLAVAAAALLLSLHCARSNRVAEESQPAPEAAGGEARAAKTRDAAGVAAPSAARPTVGDGGVVARSAAPDAGGAAPRNPVAELMRNTAPPDRELLAAIERETHHSPPPEVMELLSMRRAGKSREELEGFIDSKLASDLRIRIAAKRWLREVSGDTPPDASPKPGAGGGQRRILRPTPQP